MTLDLWLLVLLGGTGALAGFVDAVAGGGGLIALPVLLSTGMPPVAALATNKLQGSIGTGIAAITFWRRGYVKLSPMLAAIGLTFAGSYVGALSVKSIDTTNLQVGVPIALIAIAAYFLVAPKLSDDDRRSQLHFVWFVPVMGFGIGFYDGLFGPGTGSFFTAAFVTLFGLGITRAAAHTKVLNFTSNVAALALFIPAGDVIWPAAVAMALGQMTGGYIGALTGIRYGGRLIKPLVVLVSLILAFRLLTAA